jgi:hypothetical protein
MQNIKIPHKPENLKKINMERKRGKKKKTRARERGKEIMFSCRWF